MIVKQRKNIFINILNKSGVLYISLILISHINKFNLKSQQEHMAKYILKMKQAKAKTSAKAANKLKVQTIRKKIRPSAIRKSLMQKMLKNFQKIKVDKLEKTANQLSKVQLKSLLKDQHVTCSICFEIIVEPILTECGHIFCLQCIENASFVNQQCPICRNSLQKQTFKPSKQMKNLINEYVKQNLPIEQQKTYKEKADFLQGLQRKRILPQSLRKNDFIDYNHKGKWISVQVIQLYNTFLVVGIPKKEGLQKLKVFLRQRKLAKHRTYTQQPILNTTIKPDYFNRFISREPELRLIVEPYIPQIPFYTPRTILRQLNQVQQSRWDEFELINNNNWIDEEADYGIQRNLDLWNLPVEQNEFQLFL